MIQMLPSTTFVKHIGIIGSEERFCWGNIQRANRGVAGSFRLTVLMWGVGATLGGPEPHERLERERGKGSSAPACVGARNAGFSLHALVNSAENRSSLPQIYIHNRPSLFKNIGCLKGRWKGAIERQIMDRVDSGGTAPDSV